jgi:hypothetical protein
MSYGPQCSVIARLNTRDLYPIMRPAAESRQYQLFSVLMGTDA